MGVQTRSSKKPKTIDPGSIDTSSLDNSDAADKASAISEVDVMSLSPRTFWLDYVSQRKPALIEGHLQQKEWKASRKWTNDYLMCEAVCSLPLNAGMQSGRHEGVARRWAKADRACEPPNAGRHNRGCGVEGERRELRAGQEEADVLQRIHAAPAGRGPKPVPHHAERTALPLPRILQMHACRHTPAEADEP